MRTKRECVWYRDHVMYRCLPNSSGMRWFTASDAGYLRADTQAGLRKLIRDASLERNGDAS